MADRGDTHYHVPHLNLWFLFSSAFFLFTMIWTVIDDWDAEWKKYQRDFRALELDKSQEALAALDASGALALEAELQATVDDALARMQESQEELAAAETEAHVLDEKRFEIEESFKSAKSILNWEVYQTEKKLLEGEVTEEEMEIVLAPYRLTVHERDLKKEDATQAFLDKQAEVSALRAEVIEAKAELAAGSRDLTRVRDRIDDLDPAGLAKKAAGVIRDFPGLDFIGPNLKINKQVLSDLTFELNFTKKTRIDMCTTCHVGIDSEGFEDDAQPHTTHPRLDLYLTSKSPHPMKEIGCTICHRGSGESLSFQHTDHRPADAEQAEQWHHDYHWHKQHHWDYPMLRPQNIEASCVQCHKTSMELIAADAPTVTEGYRLFETKGCYECHKVDWFPVKRRPGPTLINLAAKLTPNFVDAWIAAPRDFRPTTHMPQFFHLENFPAEDDIVVSDYGAGRIIKGKEWNDNSVAAITAYLFDNHPEQELPPIPGELEGDAERGREVMNVSGCFACHNTATFEGSADDGVPALSNRVTDSNQLGPNLRGVATKVDKTWLYHWIKDPTQYWSDTRMPNLRLSDQDALDIASYIKEDPDKIFSDVPEGWEQTSNPMGALDIEVLREQARWFFQKDGRRALQGRFEGEWSDLDQLAIAVGEKLVMHQGCFSCHDISGMESMMPIGTEFSSWASKTVDKLDFGQSYLREVAGRAKLDKHYHEGWLGRKLLHPRSFDIDKVKTPKDRARMPWFDFSPEEVDQLTTFMMGLVIDEVQRAKMNPTPEQLASDAGMRAVRQNNCTACHIVEGARVTYANDDGEHVTVEGEILAFFPSDDPMPPRMTSLADFQADLAEAEDFMEEEVEDFIIRLSSVQPDAGYGVGAPDEKIILPVDRLIDVAPTTGGDFVRFVTEYYRLGTFVRNPDFDPADEESSEFYRWAIGYDEDEGFNLIEDVDGGQRPYPKEEYDKVRWTFAPPVLLNEGHKVQADWFYAFLEDPIPLRQQVRVRMPSFYFDPGEAEAIADYFAEKSRWDWYERYAKTLRLTLGRTAEPDLADGTKENRWDMSRQTLEWPTAAFLTEGEALTVEDMAQRMSSDTANALDADTIRAIEAGSKPDILANFAALHRWGESQGFSMTGPLKHGHEMIARRAPTHLADRAEFIALGQKVGVEGVNCFQCHPKDGVFADGVLPIAWAPALENVRSRLREEWVREWMWAPRMTYQGTAMPDNFAAPVPQYQEQFPNSTNDEQIQAVLDWLYNMDRPPTK